MFQGIALLVVGLFVKDDLETVGLGVADDLTAGELCVVGGLLGLLRALVQLVEAGLCALDLAAQAGQFVVGARLINPRAALAGVGKVGGELGGGLGGQTGKADKGFVLAIIGIHGLVAVKLGLQLLELVSEHFAGVGVGEVYRAGADGLDLVQDGLDLVVLFPEGALAGHLLFVLFHVVIARAGNELAGIAGLIAVVVVRPLSKAAGVAVMQRVELVVVVGADLGFPCLHQRGGLVHGGAVAVGGAAGLVVAHVDAVVSVAGRVLVDLVVAGGGLCFGLRRGDHACLFVHGVYLLILFWVLLMGCRRFVRCGGSKVSGFVVSRDRFRSGCGIAL